MVQHGPDPELVRLVETQSGKIHALGLRMFRDEHDAADVLQETFLEAAKSWHTFRGESQASTWLYRIAIRVCQRMIKKRTRGEITLELSEGFMGAQPVPALVDDSGSPLETQIDAEMSAQVEQAILDLPGEYRIPVVLKEIMGLSVKETAEALGLGEGAVKTRLHRARLKIGESLAQITPMREMGPSKYDRQVCMDLLEAKQDSLDRGSDFALAEDQFCARCASVFALLDLSERVCESLMIREAPAELREKLLESMAAAEST